MHILPKLALAVCSLALAVTGAEFVVLRGVLGYHGVSDARIIDFDERLGWRLRPNVDAVASDVEFAMLVQTDSVGLRTMVRASSIPATARRVLVLGDSFAFGWGVSADEMISARVEAGFAARGLPVAVSTGGVPGYSTDQEYLWWQEIQPQLRPEIVVLLMSANDPPANIASSVRMVEAIYAKPWFEISNSRLEPWRPGRRETGRRERITIRATQSAPSTVHGLRADAPRSLRDPCWRQSIGTRRSIRTRFR